MSGAGRNRPSMTTIACASLLLVAGGSGAFRSSSTSTSAHRSTRTRTTTTRTRTEDLRPPPPPASSSWWWSSSSSSSCRSLQSTALRGKMWKRLEIEEDDPADGTSWYLINCVAGNELDLLNQCRQVCADFPSSDVEKFVVPTERHLRSHGDRRKVVDVRVRYPGYVFCRIRLAEDVYEALQGLELARSWMGTVNRRGNRRLPPVPLPLGPEEVSKFKGLEEEQEIFEDMFGGDYTGRSDAGSDLLAQYAGYDVGQMVKVLRGNFEGEDGTVRRLKDGMLMVRMFTYGQTYDEWFDPDAVRPLTDLEALRGLGGPTSPIDQDQFDVIIGKRDPPAVEGGRTAGDRASSSSSSLRSGLLQSAGVAPGRNRREDRVARGETTGDNRRDALGRSAEDVGREERNWLAYREEKRAGQTNVPAGRPETAMKKVKEGPPKGQDTWGITERSSWNGGEYGFEANSEEEERERKRRTAEVYKDRAPMGRRDDRDGRGNAFDKKRNPRGETDSRRERGNAGERRTVAQQSRDREDDWTSASSNFDDGAGKEGDFFDSLMSELSNDLREDRSEDRGPRARGGRNHDYAGPNAKVTEKSGGPEDSFFENLMSELGGVLDQPSSSRSGKVKSQRNLDDDDFFSSLEAELSQSLGGGYGSGKKQERKDDDDDFFASLEQEMGKALSRGRIDDEELQNDFFSSLINDVANEIELPRNELTKLEVQISASQPPEETGLTQATTKIHDLSSLTVPELKDLLRSRGLKVGGNKLELINRLQSQ
ncbi:hypothetical protein ACHAW5_006123 [Stephanodiscus triporus]|uniref:SAP domain-containing protein n=1 Tax=Stephanodiscus triporus TaxID=2934178 RepID=A0ABD3MGR7_9STRA